MTFPTSLENLRIVAQRALPPPSALHEEIPASATVTHTVTQARRELAAILDGRDPRLLVVVGPCSIHDPAAAMDYARKLKALADELAAQMLIVMRVYFEKPRTTVGWKGLINDPRMDDSFHIEDGMRLARQLLVDINALGLPCGTEALDPITPQYLGDLISWSAIGARTTESQTHRELASGLSSPVGFKNGTDGSLMVAINAMLSASQPHAFLGINGEGQVAVTQTTGNPYGHLILRGGAQPNYDSVSVAQAASELQAARLPVNIVVDCSHGNSRKNHALQTLVLKDVVHQIADGATAIKGVMLESNLFEGSQKLSRVEDLRYGVSITDACLGWDVTQTALREAAAWLAAHPQGPIQRAAHLLWSTWQANARIECLPQDMRPTTRQQGYQVQAEVARLSGSPVFGWKIAATSVAGQKHIGVDGPQAGRLLAQRAFDSGALISLAGNGMLVAEAEFAFRMGRDLPPRATHYTQAEVLEAVASLHPSIEIPDSRYRDYASAGEAQLIADSACACYYVLGAATTVDWRALDLSTHAVRASVNSKPAGEGTGANVLGDPRIALAWMVNEISRIGETLCAGQVVTTGTCVVPVTIQPGDQVEVDFGVLGRANARFLG